MAEGGCVAWDQWFLTSLWSHGGLLTLGRCGTVGGSFQAPTVSSRMMRPLDGEGGQGLMQVSPSRLPSTDAKFNPGITAEVGHRDQPPVPVGRAGAGGLR